MCNFVAPFRVTLKGMIASVEASDVSQQGKAKRVFEVVDNTGAWIRCCSLGHTASSRALREGMEVVLFHGTGRSAVGASPGMIYLMKDSLIVPVGMKTVLVHKKTEIVVT